MSSSDDVDALFEEEHTEAHDPAAPTAPASAQSRLDAIPPKMYIFEPDKTALDAVPPSDGYYVFKRPGGFVLVEPEFDPDTFQVPYLTEPESIVSKRLEGYILWRREADGTLTSNANVVTWSDGTSSIVIGKQVFDLYRPPQSSRSLAHVYQQPAHGLSMFALAATVPEMTVKQSSLNATGLAKVAAQSVQKVKMAVTTKDPEAERREIEAAKKESEKVHREMERRKWRSMEAAGAGAGGPGRSMTRHFLEDDDEDGGEGPRRAPVKAARTPSLSRAERLRRRKSRHEEEEEDDDEDDEGEDEDEENEYESDDDADEEEEAEESEEEEEEEAEETEGEEEEPARGAKAGKVVKPARRTAILDSDSE